MGILTVEFKEKVQGLNEVTCIGICSDDLHEGYFLLTFSKDEIWEVPMKNIKHIRS